MFFYENELFGDGNTYGASDIDNFDFPPHFHRSYELVGIKSGKMEITIDDMVYSLKKGDVIMIFPNQIHSFKTIDKSRISLIIFSPELVGHFYSEYHNLIPENNVIKGFNMDGEKIFTDNIYLQKAVLYKAIGAMIESNKFKKANISGDFKLIHRILSFVEENYNSDCALKDAAKILKYDYAYLSKQFIKTMNMSYTEYLNRYRINRACYLISNESVSIGDIYAQCGFENARSFNRNFKKYTGITPSEFKWNINAGNCIKKTNQ